MAVPTWKTKIKCPENHYLSISAPTVWGVGMTSDEKDDTTEWVFHMIDSNRFNIINAVGASDGRSFLSVSEDGQFCFVTEKDCGEYRSQWKLTDYGENTYIFQTYKDKQGYRFLAVDTTRNGSVGYVQLFPDGQPSSIWRYFNVKMKVVDVSFKLSDAVLGDSTSSSLVRQVLPNNSRIQQSMTFIVAEKYDATSMFENSHGVSATVGTTFSTGLPFVAEGKVSLELAGSFNATWGKSQTFFKYTNKTFPVVAPPNTTVVCNVVITKTKLRVPFVFTLADGQQETGMWTGVSGWGIKAEYEEKINEEEDIKEKEN